MGNNTHAASGFGQLLVTGRFGRFLLFYFFCAYHVLLVMYRSAAIPPEEAPLIYSDSCFVFLHSPAARFLLYFHWVALLSPLRQQLGEDML